MPNETSSGSNGSTQYTVKGGDALGKIAKRFGVSVDEIMAANPQIKNPNSINVGQVLTIPAAGTPANGGDGATPTTTPVSTPVAAGKFPETDGLSEEEKFRRYADYITQRGRTLPPVPAGQRLLIGLRATTNFKSNGGRGLYDDRLVVTWTDPGGKRRVREFTFNTEPSTHYEDKDGQDCDIDGRKDLGCVQDGEYSYTRAKHDKFGSILKPDENMTVRRDADHDGDIDAADDAKVKNKNALNALRTMYFHIGALKRTGSAGCQTIQPKDASAFWNSLGNQQQTFTYVLLTCS